MWRPWEKRDSRWEGIKGFECQGKGQSTTAVPELERALGEPKGEVSSTFCLVTSAKPSSSFGSWFLLQRERLD